MNKRIRELLIQCQHESIDGPEYGQWTDIEKFAELIVRECIERVRQQYIPTRDQTVEGKLNPLHSALRLRTEREEGIVSCGVNSVIALEELIQEQTDKWYKENILGVEE